MTHNVFHLDGKGMLRHLDRILEIPQIHAIQWVQGVGDDLPILQWLPVIKKIQAAGKGVVVDLQLDELEPFIAAMKPDGLYLCIAARGSHPAGHSQAVGEVVNVPATQSKERLKHAAESSSPMRRCVAGLYRNRRLPVFTGGSCRRRSPCRPMSRAAWGPLPRALRRANSWFPRDGSSTTWRWTGSGLATVALSDLA